VLSLGSLFDGIGGFPLAARWLGIPTAWTCEIDGFCTALSKQNFPEVKQRFGDIRSIDEKNKPEHTSIISASPPCQPFSTAGQRRGVQDDRHLWPETVRVIELVKPRWIICENVYGLLSMEESSRVIEVGSPESIDVPQADGFGFVLTVEEKLLVASMLQDLEGIGYEPPRLTDGTPVIFCVPAIAVGAFHIRKRIWIIAHSDGGTQCGEHQGLGREKQPIQDKIITDSDGVRSAARGELTGRQAGNKSDFSSTIAPNSMRRGLQGSTHTGRLREEKKIQQGKTGVEYDGKNAIPRIRWPTRPICSRRAYGISGRMDRIKGAGNAIVPQIAARIFHYILEVEKVSAVISE